MKTWLTNLWDRLRSGFWFLPAMTIAAGVLLAFALLAIDVELEEAKVLPDALRSSAPAARTILSALAGALLTGTSVVFSVTMLVLAQTASQFGSRLLRTIANGNVAQVTLGLFLGTSVYCLLVLRSVREDGYGLFVPHVAVMVAVGLALACLIGLIYFLNDVASAIQAPTVVHAVHRDVDASLRRLFPREIGDPERGHGGPSPAEKPLPIPGAGVERIRVGEVGYVQAINVESLMSIATEHDLVLWIVARPGDFVNSAREVVVASPAERIDHDVRNDVGECFLLGIRRTPRQDVLCALNNVVEVGVRALSPGINDPFTAITCVDYLGEALSQLVRRDVPSPNRHDEAGALRIVLESVTFPEALHAAFDMLGRHAGRTPSVTFRMLQVLEHVAGQTLRNEDAVAIRERVDLLERLAVAELHGPSEVRDVERTAERTRERLDRLFASFGEEP